MLRRRGKSCSSDCEMICVAFVDKVENALMLNGTLTWFVVEYSLLLSAVRLLLNGSTYQRGSEADMNGVGVFIKF